jgi:subtilisin-like proprotein convertase family protein
MNLDRGGMSSGLAVYHCDILGSNELQQGTATKHYQCALLQADGERHLELNVNQSDGSDLFGAAPGIVLSSESRPNSREWDGRDSSLVISDVTAPGETIKFRVGAAAVAAQTASGQAAPDLTIPDDQPAGVSSAINISKSGTVSAIKISVNIEHSFIGDLRVTLKSPSGKLETLHAQIGGSNDNLIASYDSASPGILQAMLGQSMKGNWILNVSDRARQDTGKLKSWQIELKSASAGAAPPNAVAAARGTTSPNLRATEVARVRGKVRPARAPAKKRQYA